MTRADIKKQVAAWLEESIALDTIPMVRFKHLPEEVSFDDFCETMFKENPELAPTWTPALDELPPAGQRVWIAEQGTYNHDENCWDVDSACFWQPITPPQEGDK